MFWFLTPQGQVVVKKVKDALAAVKILRKETVCIYVISTVEEYKTGVKYVLKYCIELIGRCMVAAWSLLYV